MDKDFKDDPEFHEQLARLRRHKRKLRTAAETRVHRSRRQEVMKRTTPTHLRPIADMLAFKHPEIQCHGAFAWVASTGEWIMIRIRRHTELGVTKPTEYWFFNLAAIHDGDLVPRFKIVAGTSKEITKTTIKKMKKSLEATCSTKSPVA